MGQATFGLEPAASVGKSDVCWRAGDLVIASELELIERIRARAQSSRAARVRLGIGDDCALLRVPRGFELAVTTDFTLERRHFRRDWHTPQSVGHRCLARGLSDLAAMGARPQAAFLSLALPASFQMEWVDGFLEGLLALAGQHGVELAGGDTAEAPGAEILADMVCVGAVRRGRALLRSGARAGDRLFVTGSLGAAAVELAELAGGRPCAASAAEAGEATQSFPQPRVRTGRLLARRQLATSCMDLSDGLATDLTHLCRASGVDAEIDLARLPLGRGASVEQALTGGEDYELLFTAAAGTPVPPRLGGVSVTAIGRVVGQRGAEPAVWANGLPLTARGWEHFVSGEGNDHA